MHTRGGWLLGDLNLVILVAGRLMQVVISIASVRIMTELLSAHEVGRIAMFHSVTALVSLLAITPVSSYLQRRAIEWNEQGLVFRRLVAYASYLLLVSILCVIFSTLVLLQRVSEIFPISHFWVILLLLGYVLFTAFYQTVVSLANTLGFRGVFVLFSNVAIMLGLAVASGLTLQLKASAEWWLLGLRSGICSCYQWCFSS